MTQISDSVKFIQKKANNGSPTYNVHSSYTQKCKHKRVKLDGDRAKKKKKTPITTGDEEIYRVEWLFFTRSRSIWVFFFLLLAGFVSFYNQTTTKVKYHEQINATARICETQNSVLYMHIIKLNIWIYLAIGGTILFQKCDRLDIRIAAFGCLCWSDTSLRKKENEPFQRCTTFFWQVSVAPWVLDASRA